MDKIKRPRLIVRQHSKVEKIPDEESEELLLKKAESPETEKVNQAEENVPNKSHISNKNVNLVRALSRTSDNADIPQEVTLNGNLHIFMPSTDETCGGAITYRNGDGDETCVELEPGKKNLKRRKTRTYCYFISKCSRQSILNIVFGLCIAVALCIGIKALLTNSKNVHGHSYLYCYQCQHMDNQIQYIKRINNMCCTHDPVQEKFLPKTSPQVSKSSGPIVTTSYNGTRILEFEANFGRHWRRDQLKDIIPWVPPTNMENSFASSGKRNSEIKLLHDGRYVITLSLTTDTFTANMSTVRVNACLVFRFPDEITKEECRQITHTDKMVVPFQIFKFDALRKGTVLYAYITSSKSLNSRSKHNKLYIVLL